MKETEGNDGKIDVPEANTERRVRNRCIYKDRSETMNERKEEGKLKGE